METPRQNFSIALSPCTCFIFAFGGTDMAGDPLQTVERYDIAQNTWSNIARLGYLLSESVAVTMPDGIYLLGGSNET